MLGHNRGEQIDIIRASAFQKASDVQSVASKSFHEKAGDVKAHFRFLLSMSLFPFSQATSVAILPSALFCERDSLGARWVFSFIRCCYLISVLSSHDGR